MEDILSVGNIDILYLSNNLDEESFISSHRKPLFDKSEKETEQDVQLPVVKEANFSEQIDLQNIIQLKEAFDAADSDGSGKLEMDEFMEAFGSVLVANMDEKKLEQLFMKIDANSDGGVEWDEFMNYILLENQTLSLMKEEDFDYIKSNGEDLVLNKDGHEDMVTKVIIIKPPILAGSEPKNKSTHKFVTAGKDGNIKVYDMNGEYEGGIEASVSYILSMTYLQKSNTLVVCTESKELLFYNFNATNPQASTLVGKYHPTETTIHYLESQYVKKYKKQYILGGDENGVLYFFELSENWHICNSDLNCHQNKHKDYYWNEMTEKRKKIKAQVKDHNEKSKEDPNQQRKWLWKELERKEFFKLDSYHHIENVKIGRLQLHKKGINKIQYIPDLNVVVTCSVDSNVTIINFDLLLELFNVNDHIVSLESLKKISRRIPAIDHEKKIKTFSEHNKSVKTFAWSPKFRIMASAGDERYIILWNIFTCKCIGYLHGHTSGIQDLALNEERSHLISLGIDKMVLIWDLRSSRCLKMITDKNIYYPDDLLTCLIFDRRSERLVVTSRKMSFWPFRTKFETSGTSHDDEVTYCKYNPAFNYMISIDASNNIALWDMKDGNMVFKFVPENTGKITAACLDDTHRRMLIGDSEGKVQIYNFNNGQCLQVIDTLKNLEITNVIHTHSLDKGGALAHVIATGWEKRTYFWRESPDEVKVEKILPKSSLYDFHKVDVTCLTISEKYKAVISGDTDGWLVYWDNKVNTMRKFANTQGSGYSTGPTDKGIIKILVIDSKDVYITFSADQFIRVWSFLTHQIVYEKMAFHHENELLSTAAICEDEIHMLTADSEGYYKLWDVSELSGENPKKNLIKELVYIKAHKQEITCADFLEQNGKYYLSTCSIDKNINLYSLDGSQVGIFGRVMWDISKVDQATKLKPRLGTPDRKRHQPPPSPKRSEISFAAAENTTVSKLKARREISLLDKTGASDVFEKMERRTSIRKGFRHEPSKQTLVASPVKSDLMSSGFGEAVGNNETKEKMLRDDSSALMLETYKKTETAASPVNRKQPTPFPTDSTFKDHSGKGFSGIRRAKSSLRERVEKSIMEAEEFLKKESSLEVDNPFVGNILKKYATPMKGRQNASYGVAISAKGLDSEKHTPFKVPNKKNQLMRFLKEEQVPENKFNAEFFKKSSIFYDYNYKERMRQNAGKVRTQKGNKSFL